MKNIKAIQTFYRGYKFRSRLEARWAVFFDSLNIPWLYEEEGLSIDNEWYLPDFYLPDCKQFFEVKGIMSDKDESKIKALISKGYSVTIGYDNGRFQACDYGEDGFELSEIGDSWLCQCVYCKKYWFLGSILSYECQCCGIYDGDSGFIPIMDGDNDFGKWDISRQARFEHNETPKI